MTVGIATLQNNREQLKTQLKSETINTTSFKYFKMFIAFTRKKFKSNQIYARNANPRN